MKGRLLLVKVLLTAVLVTGGALPALSVFSGNGSGGGFCDGSTTYMMLSNCQDGLSTQLSAGASVRIEPLVEEAAGFYLAGLSDYMKLLNRVETANLKGIDYRELLTIAESARGNLAAAASVYGALVDVAAATPYNPAVRARLMDFDYGGFAFRKGIDPSGAVYKDMVAYLSKGDIRGFYHRLYMVSLSSESGLSVLCDTLKQRGLPGLDTLWRLNETLSRNLLLGQYVARVFHDIIGFEILRAPGKP